MSKSIGTAWKPEPVHKKTAQGRRKSSIKMSSMNKNTKRSHKPYRGQG